MALFKYFKPSKPTETVSSEEFNSNLNEREKRAEIGKYAADHGNASAVRTLGLKYPGLKRQTVSDFKLAYVKLKKSKEAEGGDIREIVKKKTGRPTLLPENLMKKVIETVASLRLKGAPVSAAVIRAVARGVIMANETKLDFQRKIKEFQAWHEIPEDLIVNFDQTNLPYTCIGKRTYHKQGSSNVPLVGKGKKKQITGSFAVTMTGQFLPMQLIVVFQKGVEFPDDWYVPYTKNHWTNEEKAIEHIEKVVFPYLKKQKAELKLT